MIALYRTRLSRVAGMGMLALLAASLTIFDVRAAPGPLANTPAPTYGNNVNRTNRSPYAGPQQLPVQKWRFSRDEHWGTDYRGTDIGLNNTVYLAAGMAGVYSINATTGAKNWLYSPPSTGHETWVEFPPTVASDGKLYFTSENDYAYSLDQNGNVLWSFLSDHLHTPMSISPDGNNVHFISESGHIYALDRLSGVQSWRYQLGPYRVYATGRRIPIVYDSAGNLYFVWINTVWSLTPGGATRWSRQLLQRASGQYSVGPAVADDGTLYFTRMDALTAVGMDGNVKWEYILGNSAFDRTATIGADGTVYIGAQDGFVYALNPNGTLKWKAQYVTQTGWGAGIKSNILLDAQGVLYFLGRDGFVYGVNSQTKQVLWKYNSAQTDLSYPGIQLSLDADGTIYVPVDEKVMLALASPGGAATSTPTPVVTGTPPSPTNTLTPTSTSSPTTTATVTQTPTQTSTPVQPPQGSLLANGSFEIDANGDTFPDGWTPTVGGANPLVRSGLQHYDGDYALLARATGMGSAAYQEFTVSPGQVYQLTSRVNVPANTGQFRVSIQLIAMNTWNGTVSSVTALSQTSVTNGWVPANASITIPNGATKLRIQARFEYGRSEVFVDAFTLTRTQ